MFKPLDEVETADLRRCRSCGGKLIRTVSQVELLKHVGHRLSPPADVSVWEYAKIRLGLL